MKLIWHKKVRKHENRLRYRSKVVQSEQYGILVATYRKREIERINDFDRLREMKINKIKIKIKIRALSMKALTVVSNLLPLEK